MALESLKIIFQILLLSSKNNSLSLHPLLGRMSLGGLGDGLANGLAWEI